MSGTKTILNTLSRTIPPLAAPGTWPKLFKGSRAKNQMRVSVMTEELAAATCRHMDIASRPNLSILEVLPGPGQLTRAMVLAGAKKVVTFEPQAVYRESLQDLEENSGGRIHAFEGDPSDIESYDNIDMDNEFPGLEERPWSEVHPDLALVGCVPNSMLGDRMVSSMLVRSTERLGVFKKGRVAMYLFCSHEFTKKLTAGPGATMRNRLTILAEESVEIKRLMRPGADHFYLPYDYELLKLTPFETSKFQTSFEVTDFVLRNLFMSKNVLLTKGIKLLGPGAEILLGRLNFDPAVKIKSMTVEQVNEVALKFDQWPLRPKALYEDMLMQETKRRK